MRIGIRDDCPSNRWLSSSPIHTTISGTADIFRGIMVSLYVKGKENGHVQAYAPTGAMERKPVHDFPLPFTHRRSQNYTK